MSGSVSRRQWHAILTVGGAENSKLWVLAGLLLPALTLCLVNQLWESQFLALELRWLTLLGLTTVVVGLTAVAQLTWQSRGAMALNLPLSGSVLMALGCGSMWLLPANLQLLGFWVFGGWQLSRLLSFQLIWTRSVLGFPEKTVWQRRWHRALVVFTQLCGFLGFCAWNNRLGLWHHWQLTEYEAFLTSFTHYVGVGAAGVVAWLCWCWQRQGQKSPVDWLLLAIVLVLPIWPVVFMSWLSSPILAIIGLGLCLRLGQWVTLNTIWGFPRWSAPTAPQLVRMMLLAVVFLACLSVGYGTLWDPPERLSLYVAMIIACGLVDQPILELIRGLSAATDEYPPKNHSQ